MPKLVDLTGRTFGRLLVLEQIPRELRRVKRSVSWNCRCECGNNKEVTSNDLIAGDTVSCGCYRRLVGKITPISQPKEKREYNGNWKGHGEISGTLWRNILSNAKVRKRAFNITIVEAWDKFLQQNRICPYTGIVLTFSTSRYTWDGNASLDRIDSTKGYTVDNIQWVHKVVNKMKLDLSEKEFINMCKQIAEHRKHG